MKYSIVIPTYNHCEDLLRPCVNSIIQFTDLENIELIICANGCTDNTREYLSELDNFFNVQNIRNHLKVIWFDNPIGYSKACNAAIEEATTDLIVLLNNDTIILPQEKNSWLSILESKFIENSNCGISCLSKIQSDIINFDFAIFFCVMIHRKVFDKIGLLSLDYGSGAGEDTEFSAECQKAGFEIMECVTKEFSKELGTFVGNFPLWHKGEGTVHDTSLINDWDITIKRNRLTLGEKYNHAWYKWTLSNNNQRSVLFKNDAIPYLIEQKYKWARDNIVGDKVIEIGCSSGYGLKFLPNDINYQGIDHDEHIIKVAKKQDWKKLSKFVHADILSVPLENCDTIIAFNILEQINEGLNLLEKLKKHCRRLLISVPYMESSDVFSDHTKLYNLDETYFKDFKICFLTPNGNIVPKTDNYNLQFSTMLCQWEKN